MPIITSIVSCKCEKNDDEVIVIFPPIIRFIVGYFSPLEACNKREVIDNK